MYVRGTEQFSKSEVKAEHLQQHMLRRMSRVVLQIYCAYYFSILVVLVLTLKRRKLSKLKMTTIPTVC